MNQTIRRRTLLAGGLGAALAGLFGRTSAARANDDVGVSGCQEASPVDRQGVAPAGVMGTATGAGTYAVCGVNGSGVGVRGMAVQAAGVALEGEHAAGGLALQVKGRAQFSTAGHAAVPGGADRVIVPCGSLPAGGHVLVTLAADPQAPPTGSRSTRKAGRSRFGSTAG